MPQWEYKIYDQKDGVNPDNEEELNYLGSQGWELCGICSSHSEHGGERFYFKRRKEEDILEPRWEEVDHLDIDVGEDFDDDFEAEESAFKILRAEE